MGDRSIAKWTEIVRAAVPLAMVGAESPCNTMSPGHLDPSRLLATIDMGRKVGLPCPFFGGGAGSPSSTVWPGPRPTSIPSGILSHLTV